MPVGGSCSPCWMPATRRTASSRRPRRPRCRRCARSSASGRTPSPRSSHGPPATTAWLPRPLLPRPLAAPHPGRRGRPPRATQAMARRLRTTVHVETLATPRKKRAGTRAVGPPAAGLSLGPGCSWSALPLSLSPAHIAPLFTMRCVCDGYGEHLLTEETMHGHLAFITMSKKKTIMHYLVVSRGSFRSVPYWATVVWYLPLIVNRASHGPI